MIYIISTISTISTTYNVSYLFWCKMREQLFTFIYLFTYLPVCCLFNDAVSSSDSVSSDRMINETWSGKYKTGSDSGLIEYSSRTFIQRLRKITEHSQDSRPSLRALNPGLPEHGVLLLTALCDVRNMMIRWQDTRNESDLQACTVFSFLVHLTTLSQVYGLHNVGWKDTCECWTGKAAKEIRMVNAKELLQLVWRDWGKTRWTSDTKCGLKSENEIWP
jgi:hypothetical protein